MLNRVMLRLLLILYYNRVKHEIGFTYNTHTGEIVEVESINEMTIIKVTEDTILAPNIIQELSHLLAQHVPHDKVCFANSMYLKYCLKDVCRFHDIHFDQLFPVFVIPDEWRTFDTEMFMTKLMKKAGFSFSNSCNDRVSIVTELEASLFYIQFSASHQQDSERTFLLFKNGCIMFDPYFDKDTINMKSIHFYCNKEDYTSMANDTSYYAVLEKIAQIKERPNVINLNNVKKQIFSLLKAEDLLFNAVQEKNCYDYKSVADCITHDVLKNVYVNILDNEQLTART